MKTNNLIILFITALLLPACSNEQHTFDASGSFEAEETIISAEATGTIRELHIEEGQTLQAGQLIGYIDSTQLFLRKKQLETQISALISRKPDISVQLAALESQLKTALKEKDRLTNLVQGDAAPQKQLDDINAQIDVLNRQIEAQRSSLGISTESINKDALPLQVQIEQLNDQLNKCRIINPVNGTVLVKYARVNEMTAAGKPIYKIADLSNILLRVYITNDQLSQIRLDQQVKVHTDDGKGGFKETEGTVTWINSQAEFTPKTIQTKDERANMVYAVKVKVKNDGSYKTGMYGEIKLN